LKKQMHVAVGQVAEKVQISTSRKMSCSTRLFHGCDGT